MGATIIVKIDDKDHYWDSRGNLRGWFTKEELDGIQPLPSELVLCKREFIVEDQCRGED
jgi:hypothetical protein